MKYAIIGLGFIFPRHKEAIEKTGGEIILTCDIDPEKKADFTDYKEMLASEKFKEVNTVCILTPNYLHSQMCRDVKGKTIICEKPLTIFDDFDGLEDVNVILQLRKNPKVSQLRGRSQNIDIKVKSYREPKYFDSWKGQEALSGGILYNMGVHYIDLLGYLLGEPVEIKDSVYGSHKASGTILFERGKGTYHIELSTEPCPVLRKIIINGVETDLEGATIPLNDTGVVNLHTLVYKAILEGKGTKLSEARKSLDLIKQLNV